MVNSVVYFKDVVFCVVGSFFGDLYKLWWMWDFKGYYLEYGYLCMGYEIVGGLGVKMVDFDCEVFVMVGDGFYFMMV